MFVVDVMMNVTNNVVTQKLTMERTLLPNEWEIKMQIIIGSGHFHNFFDIYIDIMELYFHSWCLLNTAF